MKQSNLLVPNVKNASSDEGESSSSLLVKGGFLGGYQENRYVFLPLGMLVMEKIKKIVMEELLRLSAIEFQLPVEIADQGENYLLQLIKEGNLDLAKEWLSIFQIQTKVAHTKEYQLPGGEVTLLTYGARWLFFASIEYRIVRNFPSIWSSL